MVWAQHKVYISRGQVGRHGERRGGEGRGREEKGGEGKGREGRGGEARRRETYCTEVSMKLAKDVLSWGKSLQQKGLNSYFKGS